MIKEKKRVNGFLFLLVLSVMLSQMAYSRRGILITSEPSLIYSEIGKYYFRHADYANSIDNFEKAIGLNPNYAEAYHNAATSYYRNGDFSKAIDYLEKSIEIKEDYAKAHYSLALVYRELVDYEKSIGYLREVTLLQPDNANAHFDLGVILVEEYRQDEESGTLSEEKIGYLKEAMNEFRTADDIKPGFPHALENANVIEEILAKLNGKNTPAPSAGVFLKQKNLNTLQIYL